MHEGQDGAEDLHPQVDEIWHQSLVVDPAQGMVQAQEAGVQQVLEVADDDAWIAFHDTPLHVDCDEAVQVFDGNGDMLALKDGQQTSLEKLPGIVRGHVVQAKDGQRLLQVLGVGGEDFRGVGVGA